MCVCVCASLAALTLGGHDEELSGVFIEGKKSWSYVSEINIDMLSCVMHSISIMYPVLLLRYDALIEVAYFQFRFASIRLASKMI